MNFRFDSAQLGGLREVAAPHRKARRPRDAVTFSIPIGKPPPCPNHYIVDNHREAYRRVLWSNPTPRHDRSQDVVGPTGHLERASAWTHVLAAALFVGYAFARIWLIDQHTLASQLSGVSITLTAFMFATSVLYHVFSTVPACAPHMRNIDHLAIYMSMGIASVADAALVTNGFADVPLQCALDPILATTALSAFFMARRYLLSDDETRTDVFEDSCQLGLYRFQHMDLEHAGLRTTGITVLLLLWVLLLPAAVANLSPGVLALHIVSRTLGSIMLMLGVFFDNTMIPDKALAGKEAYWERTGVACGCASKRGGCVMSAHAWWHVVALVATILLVGSREYGVSQMAH
ncbi:MAG: hemolysin III family protein [Actinomycetales bacterium]|tara:strand:- start:4 stop:1044 length:1041 start_codon:yes stop_codon:yes gene_type:complete